MTSRRTWETLALDAQPELRQEIAESPEFREWQSTLPSFEMDGETFYLPWGDVPMDADQIAYYWGRSKGLIQGEGETDEPA